MKGEVVKSEKNLLTVKFDEMDQGILNFIREELWNDTATEMAGFQITHPQIGHAIFTLKTKGKSPKSVWNSTVDRLSKRVEDLTKEVKKIK